MTNSMKKAVFTATIPPIMSALRTGGDGMRIMFDVPETSLGEGAKLIGMRGKVLRVTVELLEDAIKKPTRTVTHG